MADHEHMTGVACRDPELSQELREALALLRDRSNNDEFCALVDDVLAGRCSLLEASGTAAPDPPPSVYRGSRRRPPNATRRCSGSDGGIRDEQEGEPPATRAVAER